MSTPDPLAEAEVLLAYGRTKEAERTLREALNRDPTRLDLQGKLETLATSRREPGVAKHVVMAWLLFVFSAVVTLGPVLALLPLSDRLGLPPAAEVNPLWILVGVVAIVGPFALAWFYLFLVLWFRYLRTLPNELRWRVEKALPRVLNVAAFEPAYSRMRSRFFTDNGA